MPSLFDSLTIGELQLPNRVMMAPLTRLRAGETKVPNALMAEYYAQRASAGLPGRRVHRNPSRRAEPTVAKTTDAHARRAP
jgi:2,4-dienoyl-CoA reductase-like NADH-dependent reductase (Old Yellow Enzyme family)